MFTQKDRHAIFRVRCREADQTYLMVSSDAMSNQTIEMAPIGGGKWEVELELPPGSYRYRFYAKIRGAMVYQPAQENAAFWVDGWDAPCEVRTPESLAVAAMA